MQNACAYVPNTHGISSALVDMFAVSAGHKWLGQMEIPTGIPGPLWRANTTKEVDDGGRIVVTASVFRLWEKRRGCFK